MRYDGAFRYEMSKIGKNQDFEDERRQEHKIFAAYLRKTFSIWPNSSEIRSCLASCRYYCSAAMSLRYVAYPMPTLLKMTSIITPRINLRYSF